MSTNNTAVILTIVGGFFYVLGGAIVALVIGALSGVGGSGLTGNTCSLYSQFCGSLGGLGGSGLDSLGYAVAGFGIFTGVVIMICGFLFGSPIPGRRKLAGILAAIMILLGGLETIGGLVIGFILAAIGVYLGLTYRSNNPNMVIGLGPIGAVTLGPNSSSVPPRSPTYGTGPTNYCIKCGTQLRPGAIFCQACGERV